MGPLYIPVEEVDMEEEEEEFDLEDVEMEEEEEEDDEVEEVDEFDRKMEEEDDEVEEVDEFDRKMVEEEEEEEEEEDVDEEEENDLQINILFHNDPVIMTTSAMSSNTAGQLVDHIRDCVRRQEKHSLRHLLPLQIKDEGMIIFQGKDLGQLSSHILKDLGMVGRADIFIVYPGPFVGGRKLSMSSKFLSLVESARTASQTDIAVEEFLDKSKVSSEGKNIFVEVPLSDGMDLVIPVVINFTDDVECVKSAIRWRVLCASEFDVRMGWLPYEEFDLFLEGTKLDSNALISVYGVKEDCTLKMSRKSSAIAISAPLHSDRPMLSQDVKLELSDSVRKVKARVDQVTGTPPEWQLLRYQNMFLTEESKSLMDLGIRFFFRDFFPWAPENGVLQLLARVR